MASFSNANVSSAEVIPTREQFDARVKSVDETLRHLSVQCDKPSEHQEGDCGNTYNRLRLTSLAQELFSPTGEVIDPSKASKVFQYLDTVGKWAKQADAAYPQRGRALPLVREANEAAYHSKDPESLRALVPPLMQVSNISAKSPIEAAGKLESFAKGQCYAAPLDQSLRNYRRMEPTLASAGQVVSEADSLLGHGSSVPNSPPVPTASDGPASNSNRTGVWGFISWLFGW